MRTAGSANALMDMCVVAAASGSAVQAAKKLEEWKKSLVVGAKVDFQDFTARTWTSGVVTQRKEAEEYAAMEQQRWQYQQYPTAAHIKVTVAGLDGRDEAGFRRRPVGGLPVGQRPLQPVGVISAPDGHLPTRAQLAAVDGVLRVALQFDRAGFAGGHMQAATGRTLTAGRRVDRGNPRRNLFGLHHIGHEVFDGVRAAGGRGATEEAGH